MLVAPDGDFVAFPRPPVVEFCRQEGGDGMSTEIRLTDDADYVLCVLYDAYKTRRKNGESSFESRLFGSSECIQEDYIQQWPTDDIDDAARELSEKGLASCLFADNALAEFALERDGIAFMEHRFGDRLDNLSQRIAALRSMIFG